MKYVKNLIIKNYKYIVNENKKSPKQSFGDFYIIQ